MGALYLPIMPFVLLPPLAFLPAAVFFWAYFKRVRSRLVLAAGAVWVIYALYETRMYLWSQGIVAPIRVDLVVVAPLLYAATGMGWFGLRREAEGR